MDASDRLCFKNNPKLLFKGLCKEGHGRLWREEFMYLDVLSNANLRMQRCSPLVKELISWVQEEFDSPQAFLDRVGLETKKNPHERKPPEDETRLTVADLAARLTALGFPGNSLQVSMIAAKAGGRPHIFRGKLLGLIVGKYQGAPPQPGVEMRLACSSVGKRSDQKGTKNCVVPWRPRKVWKDTADRISSANSAKAPCARTYFSVPNGVGGFSLAQAPPDASTPRSTRDSTSRIGSVSPRVNSNLADAKRKARTRSSSPQRRLDFESSDTTIRLDQSTTADRSRTSGKDLDARPAWDNNLFMSSEFNSRLTSYARNYFSNYRDQPIQKRIQRKMAEGR